MNKKTMKILNIIIKDYLVDKMIEHEDLKNTWMALKQEYKSRNPDMILNLKYKLFILKFQNFTSIEEFFRITQKINNQLIALGEKVQIKTLVQIMLNGLSLFFNNLLYRLISVD